MVRKKEYKKIVAQQNCVFEQRLRDKLSRKSAKQKGMIKPVDCPNCGSTHFCPR